MSEDGALKPPPPGFAPRPTRGKFSIHNGPSYLATGEGDLRCGIWVLDRHCNGMGFMHGGMVSSFADGALAWAVWYATRKMSVTLKLTTSFFGTIRPGDWLEAAPRVTSNENGVVHVTADMTVRGILVARADATFRVLRRTAK